jgi:hypothetical protein
MAMFLSRRAMRASQEGSWVSSLKGGFRHFEGKSVIINPKSMGASSFGCMNLACQGRGNWEILW